jgi:hypothetical protein
MVIDAAHVTQRIAPSSVRRGRNAFPLITANEFE